MFVDLRKMKQKANKSKKQSPKTAAPEVPIITVTEIKETVITSIDATLPALPLKRTLLDRKLQITSRRPDFTARSSRLDTHQIMSLENPYRGFFTAFWIGIAFYTITTLSRSYRDNGVLIKLQFFQELMGMYNSFTF